MKKSTLLLIFIFIILLFLGVGVYYFSYKNTLKPLQVGSTEKITIGNIGEYSIFNLIAKKNGYFSDNGLDAKIVEYASGPPAMADLLSGKADIAIAADFVGARNIFTNKDLRILAAVDKHQDFQMVVRKDSGIKSPPNLKGKRIGVTLQGAGEFFLGRFLSFNDIDANEVQIINMTPEEMVQKLENGEIDACVIFNTYTYKIEEKMGDKVDVWPIQRSRGVFATAYTTGNFIRSHPDVAELYLRSLLMAEKYLKEHPEESKEILARSMNYDRPYISYIWSKFDFDISLSQEFLLALEDDARFIIKNKLIGDAEIMPNYLDFIYFDALQNIKPEAVSIIH